MDFVLWMHVHKDKNSKRLLSAGASVDILAYCVFVENKIFVFKKAFLFLFLNLQLKCSVNGHALIVRQVIKWYTLG